MIGFACPWCDHEVRLQPQSLAAGHIVCPECRTQVDLTVGPALVPAEPGSGQRKLARAA